MELPAGWMVHRWMSRWDWPAGLDNANRLLESAPINGTPRCGKRGLFVPAHPGNDPAPWRNTSAASRRSTAAIALGTRQRRKRTGCYVLPLTTAHCRKSRTRFTSFVLTHHVKLSLFIVLRWVDHGSVTQIWRFL